MKRLLILTLGTALAVGACGPTPSDATDTSRNLGNGAAAGASVQPGAENGGAAGRSAQPAAAEAAAPAGPVYREVTIPAGTTLPLALTRSIASAHGAVDDTRPDELIGRANRRARLTQRGRGREKMFRTAQRAVDSRHLYCFAHVHVRTQLLLDTRIG